MAEWETTISKVFATKVVALVMKDGDIIEQGSHEDLIAQNGFYAELYNSQFEEVG